MVVIIGLNFLRERGGRDRQEARYRDCQKAQ
jgi:hypothetical protein